MHPRIRTTTDPRTHPARLKTAGKAKAPVPTIKLKT